jgi:hypothetical protein
MLPKADVVTTWRNGERVVTNNFFINHPDEEIEKYRGLYVAWSMDGRQVLASGKTPTELGEAVKARQLGDDEWVFSYVERLDEPLRIGIIVPASEWGGSEKPA